MVRESVLLNWEHLALKNLTLSQRTTKPWPADECTVRAYADKNSLWINKAAKTNHCTVTWT